MRCDVFTDPRYHTQGYIDLDPAQVVDVEEKTVKLFMGGRHRVTQVTLKSGEQLLLRGDLATRIQAARRQAERPQMERPTDGRDEQPS